MSEFGGSVQSLVQSLDSDSDYEEWSVTEDTNDVSLDSDEANVDNNMFKPLYDGASITVCGAYCALMEFKRASRLPFTTIEKLLELLRLLCPSNNKLPSSIYKLKKFFKNFSSTYSLRHYCRLCHTELLNNQKTCSACRPTDPDTLISFDPKRAIKQVLQSKNSCSTKCHFINGFLSRK